jgi:hypothetical protein
MTKARTNASASPAVGRNMVINGAMNVAQRSASVTGIGASSGYVGPIDRFRISAGTTAGRLTASQTSDGPNGISANCLKFDCTTADTSIAAGEKLSIEQRFEGQNLQRIGKGVAGAKQVTVSFYVKANASFTFACELYDHDNSRQISKLFSVTSNWSRVELTFPADVDDGSSPFGDDNALSLSLFIALHAGSNFTSGTLNTSSWANATDANRLVGIDSFYSSTDNNFFITGVQMEVGPVATEFEQEQISTTLAKCQRYYYQHTTGNATRLIPGSAVTYDADFLLLGVQFPFQMRGTPSLVETGGTNFLRYFHTDASLNFDEFGNMQEASSIGANIYNESLSGLTDGNVGWVRAVDASYVLAFDSEL